MVWWNWLVLHQKWVSKKLKWNTLYTKMQSNSYMIIGSIYLNDMVFIDNNKGLLNEFKNDMMKQYEMMNFGLLHQFFLLDKFGLYNCKSICTPLVSNKKLSLMELNLWIKVYTKASLAASFIWLQQGYESCIMQANYLGLCIV